MDLLFSDFDSFSDSSNSEDQDGIEFTYGGQADRILSSLEETIGKIDDFLSFERGFIHGDVVCSETDSSGQMGRVVNVDMNVDLENVHGYKIKGVNSKKLRKIRSISVGDYVVHGPWLGRVDKVTDRVTILFDDGMKCEFTTMGHEKLVPISPDLLEDSQYPYYPGQKVRVEPKSARWLCGMRKKQRDEGTVCAVDTGFVYVDWIACALFGCERDNAPLPLQDSKNLTLLSCFSHANWQLGDWCILPNDEDGNVIKQIFLKRNLRPNYQEIFVIVKIKTKIDVLWQDGSQSLGLDSQSLFPINVVDAHDFWPEQFVLENGSSDDPNVPSIQKWGVVKCVDAKERIVKVKWQHLSVNKMTDLGQEHTEETMSAYELVEHPDYSYCVGDAVFRLEKSQFVGVVDGKSYKDCLISKTGMVEEAALKCECYGGDQSEYSNNCYLYRIGIVIDFKDGQVEVKWATGLTSKVPPYEIFRVDKYEDLYATSVFHDGSIEGLSEERVDHDNQYLGQERKALLDFSDDAEHFRNNSSDSSSFSLPRAAIGFLTSIATNLFGISNNLSQHGQRSGIPNDEEILELSELCTEESTFAFGDLHTFGGTNSEKKVEENEENKDIQFSSGNKHPERFRQFDMVTDCSDHHFVAGASTLSQVKGSWLKKVQQEWSILEKNLPETIYVRAYEERMDLLRAAIVGAPGTPYHDGLFFFDIFLPPDYPHEPPMVHYNSGGLRLNPNLYESGKVCLSLLNTWTGTGSEVWNPGSSTILQVLISLQALVLNEKPYFNEAGYDKHMGRAEGEKNSISYNENAFLVSCKSMLYVLRKPPEHFETLVGEHFSRRCEYILLACKSYMEGASVGCAFGYRETEQENQKGSSTGFKIMLDKLFPKLVETFSDKGIDCSRFIEPEK